MASSVCEEIVVPCCEQSKLVCEEKTQPHSRHGFGAVWSESLVECADERTVPKPGGSFSIVSSEDLLSVHFGPELCHVSNGDSKWISNECSQERGRGHAAFFNRVYKNLIHDSGDSLCALSGSNLSTRKSNM